jgi:hypothetical protein
LAAETVLNREDVPVPGLDLAFAHLGLDKQALEQLQTRRQKVNPDGGLYLREALVRLLCCDIDGSIRAARIARDFSPTMAVPLIHAVACFLKADMSEAGRLLGQISAKDWTEYERGLGALVELYQEGAFSSEESQISTRVESDNWMVALARLAAGGKPSLEFLGVVPHEGLSDQVRTLLIQIMGFGIAEEWRPALGQKIDSLLLSRPYLATRCNWDVDNWVVRKVWNDWIQTQTVHCEARDWIELFWQKIDAAEPPAAEHVTPRKLDERIGADPSSLA